MADGGRSVNCRRGSARSRRRCNASGVRRGDRVAVLLHNRPEFVESYFAITGIGAILVPLNWRLHAAEHAALLADAEPKLLIAARDYAPTFRSIAARGAVAAADSSSPTAPSAPTTSTRRGSAPGETMPDDRGRSPRHRSGDPLHQRHHLAAQGRGADARQLPRRLRQCRLGRSARCDERQSAGQPALSRRMHPLRSSTWPMAVRPS